MAELLKNLVTRLKPYGKGNVAFLACRNSQWLANTSQPTRHRVNSAGLTIGHKVTPSRSINSVNIRKLRTSHGNASAAIFSRAGYVLAGITGGVISAHYLGKLLSLSDQRIAMCKDSQITASDSEEFVDQNPEIQTNADEGQHEIMLKLYQYQSCPFCCKVRAFLDYYDIQYEKIEVNPLMRGEIRFSKYRKVPLAIVGDTQVMSEPNAWYASKQYHTLQRQQVYMRQ